ncbi:hypothetical protein Tco_1299811, partial [Tanacetum coccineum]
PDVYQDELCPPNKRYDIMDANKKVDLENVQCPSESKILMNIITNHPLRFSIAASVSVPWIYMAQFWHTLREDGSKIESINVVTGWDQPPLQIMQMLYCFVNNIHVDYAELMWEGIYYSLHHPATSIPYPRFTKIIISHYMTIFPDISRRARDAYHNLQDDDIMKNIFNSGRNKNKVGMRIPAWMITDEMKLTEHYKMYAEVFGLDVPLTQSQPTESTQGTHRTPSAPRSPNPATETAESSVPKRSTVIRFRLPSRQSARLTPPVPVPSAEKADEMILQDMIQVSLAEHKSREEQEARENVALVYEHLAAEEIEKLVEDPENVDDSSPPRHDDTSIPGTRLEPRSDKESPEVEIVQEKEEETTKDTEVEPDKDTPMVDVTNIVPPVNVDDEEDEISDEVFELRRRVKGKNVEETRISPIPSPTRSPRNLSTLGQYSYLFAYLKKRFMPRTSSDQLADTLHDVMMETLPSLVKEKVTEQADPLLQQQDIAIWLAIQMKFEKTQVPQTACRSFAVRTRDQDDPHDDAQPEGENSPSTSGNQEQDDEFDFWTDSYASDDDEILTKQVIQDIMEEISLTIDEAKLKKMVDEMLRQRCTSGNEHQYHVDQMKNFLQSDIVWESRKEILVSPHPRKITPLVQSCQRDPESLALSLINQDLLSLVIWERVHDFQLGIESYQQKINFIAPIITFQGIEEYDVFSIVYEPVHGMIYTNSKKEKRVMRHSEIHKFCDATLRRTLEGLKSYYNDVKSNEKMGDVREFLKLFDEEIEVRLNYRDQMRRWEMYVNGTPLRPRREHPE